MHFLLSLRLRLNTIKSQGQNWTLTGDGARRAYILHTYIHVIHIHIHTRNTYTYVCMYLSPGAQPKIPTSPASLLRCTLAVHLLSLSLSFPLPLSQLPCVYFFFYSEKNWLDKCLKSDHTTLVVPFIDFH